MTGLYTTKIKCLPSRLLSKDTPGEISRLSQNSTGWLGFYARDELPYLQHTARPFALVFNTHSKDKPGQHWLAIYTSSSSPTEFFDSFGIPPSFYGLSNSFIHTSSSFQLFTSDLCGNYALYFIFMRSRNITFSEIVSILSSFAVPDNHVRSFVHHLQRIYRTSFPCTRTGQCCTFKCSFC